ncbi:MAG TPA: hypothetical protein VM261_01525 [Kofleriaceae bacterium]|nr:hypothetical protein [Kofleriaceae bacterium]
MRATWLHALLFASVAPALAVGCGGGDDDEALVDGATPLDSGSDGAPADCHPESDDSRNGTTSEPTGAVFAGQRIAVCGNVDVDQPSGDVVDRDLYQVTVAPNAPVVVRLTAPLGGEVDRLDLIVRDASGPRSIARVRAGNAVTALLLQQGEYTLGVEAHDAQAVTSFPYRIEMFADNPAMRCPPMTGGTIHAETNESAVGHRANDVIDVRQQPPVLVASATSDTSDAPDATGVAVTAGSRFAITGTSAGVVSTGDEYRDRDTYALYTGATTNQLDIRVVWTGGIADLDVLVFEDGKPTDPMGTPSAALIGEEIVVTAVAPQSQYWLWVGGSKRSTSLPVDYTVHVCGREIAASPN